ncbi:MAG TPA: GNAT family N-acetyltransferase [Thermoleophilaceae bacterium]|nr:GNAT family N-acetyltransferase [Thermoleophilaceae bacterium]
MQIRSGGSGADVNELVRINGAVFEPEYGLEPSFAGDMALQLAELRRSGWPGPRDGLWMAELDGRAVGAITLRDLGGGLARLGHLALLPEARGAGAGRGLIEAVLGAARAAGYARIELLTFSELAAARELYRRTGFAPISSEPVFRWGRRLDWERWELAL